MSGSRGHDSIATSGAAFLFSSAMGVASVAVPLLALQEGYGVVAVGLLAAVPAVSQMLTRLVLGAVMRVVSDWVLIATAAVMLTVANAMLVASVAVAPFVIAQLFQGVARACFWTGSQTHVVRGEGSSVKALAAVELVSGAGQLAGPVLGGVLAAGSASHAVAAGAVLAALSLVPAFFLDRLPPFQTLDDRPSGRIWRRPVVALGCLASASGGAWRGVLTSYVPVLLAHAGYASSTIGGMVAVGNGAAVAGSAVAGRTPSHRIVPTYALATTVTGVALAVLGFVDGQPVLAATVLAVSGLAAGMLQTIGPAMAADGVHPEERGDAIAAVGTYRAAALFAVPFGAAAMLLVLPLSGVFAVTGGLIALPALRARSMRGRQV